MSEEHPTTLTCVLLEQDTEAEAAHPPALAYQEARGRVRGQWWGEGTAAEGRRSRPPGEGADPSEARSICYLLVVFE